MSITRRAADFSCDAEGCPKTLHRERRGNETVPPPVGWYTDLTHHFHACSLRHKERVNDAHLALAGKRLLWLTYSEARR